MTQRTKPSAMRAFVRGDWDGFFVLAPGALTDFILMYVLLVEFLGFSQELFYQRVLPAAAIGLVIGNLFYARAAIKLGNAENRDDATALPFGTSAIVSIVFVYLIMYPVQQGALHAGLSKEQADLFAWHAGIAACVGSGLIEFFGAFFVDQLRRVIPRVALLTAVAGTGLAFVSLDYIFRTFAYPIIGLPTLGLAVLLFFGGRSLRNRLPGGLVVLATGIIIAWILYAMSLPSVVPGPAINTAFIGINLPAIMIGDVIGSWRYLVEYLPVIAPIGFIFLIGSLQNIEAAAAAGDRYEPRPMLLVNGLSSLATGFCGSPFPTTIYLGQPAYKLAGARAGYATLNAIVWTFICMSGTLSIATHYIPIEAGMALVIFVGIVVVAQGFEAADIKYFPAVVLGLVPALAAYLSVVLKNSFATAAARTGTSIVDNNLIPAMADRNFFAEGVFALSQGYLFSSMIITTMTMLIIDGKYRQAAGWTLVAAAMSAFGIIHGFSVVSGDITATLNFPLPTLNQWTLSYILFALLLYAAHQLTSNTKAPALAASAPSGSALSQQVGVDPNNNIT